MVKRTVTETLMAAIDPDGRVTAAIWNREGTPLPNLSDHIFIECDPHVNPDYDYDKTSGKFRVARNDAEPHPDEPQEFKAQRAKLPSRRVRQ